MKTLMIRLGLFFVLCSGITSISPREALALNFTDTIRFATPDHNYTTVAYAAGQSYGFSWDHTVLKYLDGLTVGDIAISNLKLTVVFSQTHANEDWIIEGAGHLSASSAMTHNEFDLGGIWERDFVSDGIINLRVIENTPGADSFRLYSSKVTGNIEEKVKSKSPEIPEWGTLSALLAGLGILRIFRSGRAHDVAQG